MRVPSQMPTRTWAGALPPAVCEGKDAGGKSKTTKYVLASHIAKSEEAIRVQKRQEAEAAIAASQAQELKRTEAAKAKAEAEAVEALEWAKCDELKRRQVCPSCAADCAAPPSCALSR